MKTIFRKGRPPLRILEREDIKPVPKVKEKPKVKLNPPHSFEVTREPIVTSQPKIWIPFRNRKVEPTPMLKCGKCNTVMPAYKDLIADHLKQCQPDGAKCARCGEVFKPEDFLDHIIHCEGKKGKEIKVDIKPGKPIV